MDKVETVLTDWGRYTNRIKDIYRDIENISAEMKLYEGDGVLDKFVRSNLENVLCSLWADIEKLTALKSKIDRVLNQLDEREYKIVKLRYYDRLTFPAIALRMAYSERTIYYIHRSTCEKLARSISDLEMVLAV